jgi:hypothetical protein
VTTAAIANLAGPLSPLEGFNVWLWGDFRFVPSNPLQSGALVGFAAVLLVFAIVRALERRDLAWVGAVVGCALVYAYAAHSQSPYVAAKALVIPAPLVVLGSSAALIRQFRAFDRLSFSSVAVAVAALGFFILCFESSYLALRDAEVGPVNHVQELRSLRRYLQGRPTLVLFFDDYFKWELLGVPASSPLFPSPTPAAVSPAKPWAYGQALDFNSVDAATLNRFDYVITTRTNAQSQPPSNFRLVASSGSYEVWKRVGETRQFSVLPESGRPGAFLDCRVAADRQISRQTGIAAVRTAPRYFSVPSLAAGQSTSVTLRLPPGTWQLSLPFVSTQAVTVRGPGLNVSLPPNLDRPGNLWPVGTVYSTGAPISLNMTMTNPALLPSGRPVTQYFTPEQLVAAPDRPDQIVPLRSACGRYVDWYQVT